MKNYKYVFISLKPRFCKIQKIIKDEIFFKIVKVLEFFLNMKFGPNEAVVWLSSHSINIIKVNNIIFIYSFTETRLELLSYLPKY